MGDMRVLLALAVVIVTGCSDGSDVVSVKDACAEQADAWCSIVEQCDSWSWPDCVRYRTDDCLSEMTSPVPFDDQDACLDILYRTELTDACAIEEGAWWPEECACTRDGSCR